MTSKFDDLINQTFGNLVTEQEDEVDQEAAGLQKGLSNLAKRYKGTEKETGEKLPPHKQAVVDQDTDIQDKEEELSGKMVKKATEYVKNLDNTMKDA
jgi:hypothetical protein